MWLWSFTNNEGICWPSLKTLTERCGVKQEDTVRAAVKSLEARGLLKIQKRFREDGSQSTNAFALFVVAPEKHEGEGACSTIGDPPRKNRGAELYPERTNKISNTGFNKDVQQIYDLIISRYNTAAEASKTPRCTKLTAARRQHLNARLKDHPYPASPVWEKLFSKLAASAHLAASPWFSFDWTFKSTENLEKVARGWTDFTRKQQPANWAPASALEGLKRCSQKV